MSYYYNTYFRDLYPYKEFHPSIYHFTKIKEIFSPYFFDKLRNSEITTSNLVLNLKNSILNNDLPIHISQEVFKELLEIATNYHDEFDKYFTDLVEIIRHLIISSRTLIIIGARLKIMPLVDYLDEHDVNLIQTHDGLYHSVRQIFDILKENTPNLFPERVTVEDLSGSDRVKRKQDYRKIVGSKLKLFVIKNIDNGKYFNDGDVKCPECEKEGFHINTGISRLKDIELHHSTDEKENGYTADKLFQMFTKDRSNPYFLEDLIDQLESEQVQILCRNHHSIFHDKYYNYFKYIINYEDLLCLPAEIIYILIRTSVDNFKETKNKSIDEKKEIKRDIIKKIRKKYIFEYFYGEFCPTCREFSILKHLSGFHFNHLNERENPEVLDVNRLYRDHFCSEIVQIFIREKGGFMCGNCHAVFHYDHLHLLDDIYEDEIVVEEVLDDYNDVCEKFFLINDLELIGDPLKKDGKITDSLTEYFLAIHEISKSGRDATTSTLEQYMDLTKNSIYSFFQRNLFIEKYVDIKIGSLGWNGHPTTYTLNEGGKNAVSLIYHFSDYFSSI